MRSYWIVIVLVLHIWSARATAQTPDFHWPTGMKAAVCLTYDDGVDIHLDHAIPDLNAADLHGTFYIPGRSTSLYERMEEWRAAAEHGHELGNHSLVHPCARVGAAASQRGSG